MPEQMTPEHKANALWKEIRSMTPSQIVHAMVDVQIAIRPTNVIGKPITEDSKEYWEQVKKFI